MLKQTTLEIERRVLKAIAFSLYVKNDLNSRRLITQSQNLKGLTNNENKDVAKISNRKERYVRKAIWTLKRLNYWEE